VGRSPSGDPRALAVAGTALAQRGLNSKTGLRWPAPGADSVARTARALLDRALAERPDEPNWLAQYGFTFLDESGPVHEGIGALIRAQETWPRRADIAGALSVLNLRAGNRGAALALYKRIPWAPDRARWRWIAGDLLAQSARVEISDFLREGRHAEAESLATSLRRDVTGTGMAARFENMLGWIRDSAQRAKGR
jgi:hypothetical protein